ncbi:MAG: hypothetical protein WDZ58_03075, partial [Gemmatimonadaceae bacterium]
MRYSRFALLAVAVACSSIPARAQAPDTVATDSIPDTPAPERRARNSASVSVTSGGGYNRAEGMPVLFGPVVATRIGTTRLRISTLGVLRSAGTFRMDGENIGHDLRLAALFDPAERSSLVARAYDLVDAVEDWQIP